MCNYVRVLSVLFTSDTWTRHSSAVAADPALQQAIVQVLVDHCLPATAEALQVEAATGLQEQGTGWQMLLRLDILLRDNSLRPAVAKWGRAPGAAVAVGRAAAILSLLPTSRAGAMPGDAFSRLLFEGTSLLVQCLYGVLFPDAAGMERGSEAAPTASDTELSAAAQIALQLVPRLVSSYAAELDDPQACAAYPAGVPIYFNNLSVACCYLAQPLSLPFLFQLEECSAAQLNGWLAAVTATLRLLPRLSALDAQLKQHGSEMVWAERCCSSILEQLVRYLPQQLGQIARRMQQLSGSAAVLDGVAWGSLQAHLWALHTSLCRLVAALTAPVEPLSLPGVSLDGQAWRQLLFSLNASLLPAIDAHWLAQGSQARATSRMQFLAEAPG